MPSGMRDRSFIDAEDYRPPIPFFYKHHNGIIALKSSSEQGCALCDLFWHSWVKTLSKPDFTDHWLEATFEGTLYIGCSGWTISREGLPYVTVTQQPSSGGTRTLCSFEVYVDRDDVPINEHNLLGRAVYDDASSGKCLSVAAKWLHTCLTEHTSCVQTFNSGAAVLPTRVIEVGNETKDPRVVLTSGRRDTWVALSYCWGGNSAFVLNKTTMEDLKRGIPLDKFPATLRDAIIITRSLDVKYLWIDALCILQDSPHDWAIEAAKMREVYSGALLTIAAANSPSANTGIFSERKSSSGHVGLEWKSLGYTSLSAKKVYLRPGSELWDNTLQSSPLMGRGWTLQEGLLAPRTLSYGPQQMIWECSTYQADEGGRITIPTQDYRGKSFIQTMVRGGYKAPYRPWKWVEQLFTSQALKQDQQLKLKTSPDPYQRWCDIVQQFARRSLTKDTDTLPALAGLAREFQRITKDTYCAGLWKNDIIRGMLWDRLPIRSKDGATRWAETKPSEYIAPSWSWAGLLGGQAGFRNWRAKDVLSSKLALSIADVLDVSTNPKGPDPFGQIEGGKIIMRARFYALTGISMQLADNVSTFGVQISPDATTHESHFRRFVRAAFREIDRIEYEFVQQHVPAVGQEFAIIEVVRWAKAPGSGVPGMEFIALESVGRGHDEYRRIGLFSMWKERVPSPDAVGPRAYNKIVGENKAWEEVVSADWERRIVTIV